MRGESTLVSAFIQLEREREELQIRLYGVLWKLVLDEVISESKARELADMTPEEFRDMLEEIINYGQEEPSTKSDP